MLNAVAAADVDAVIAMMLCRFYYASRRDADFAGFFCAAATRATC